MSEESGNLRKYTMACRPFEGPLHQQTLFGGKKRWVRLFRGTITISPKRADTHDETKRRKKPSIYKHLDFAEIIGGRVVNPYKLKLRLSTGEVLRFQVPVASGAAFRAEWVLALQNHIAYANRCSGITGPGYDSEGTRANLMQLAKESEDRVYSLEESLVAFNLALRNIQPRLLNSDVTRNLHNVIGAAEKAHKAVNDFCDAVLQENQAREEEVVLERDRARLTEDTLEVVTQKYNSLLMNLDRRSEKSSRTSSEYFTPEGSLRGFEDVINDDDGYNFPPETLAFAKDPSASVRSEEIDIVEVAAQRRLKSTRVPRIASYGPMSVDGSSYYHSNGDLLSNGYATSSSDLFQDCVSVDTRSFVVNNGFALEEEPNVSASNEDSLSFKTAKSGKSKSHSDVQSFKSAVSFKA